jgi:hypothetical protein
MTPPSCTAKDESRHPKRISAPACRSAQRRSTRSSTICDTLLGSSGVGQSE